MAGNKKEDPKTLFRLLAGFKKDIKQQVDEATDFYTSNKAEIERRMIKIKQNDNSKIYSWDDPPIPIPDFVMEQQRLAALISFILMLLVHMKDLKDTVAKLKVKINDLETELNLS